MYFEKNVSVFKVSTVVTTVYIYIPKKYIIKIKDCHLKFKLLKQRLFIFLKIYYIIIYYYYFIYYYSLDNDQLIGCVKIYRLSENVKS